MIGQNDLSRSPFMPHPSAYHSSKARDFSNVLEKVAVEVPPNLAQERLALALDAGGMGVWEWDLASGRSLWNAQMYRLLGMAQEGQEACPELFMATVNREDRIALEAKVLQALTERTDFSDEFRITRADTGEERWISGRGRVFCDETGKALVMLGVNFDITKEMHNQEKLSAVTQRRAEFLAVLGHELRNPLAPLAYVARMLESPSESAITRTAAADLIKRQVSQLKRLVDDLLEVSRIELGKIELQLSVWTAESLVLQAAEAVIPAIHERSQHLTLNVAPDVRVCGDAARLIQVLSNLLSNASQFTPPGSRIRVEVYQDDQLAWFEVSDNGPGIETGLLRVLFDAFTQGSTTLDRSHDGLGLGLSIVRRLVEMHGGTVTVVTSSGGSKFKVALPRPQLTEEAPSLSRRSGSLAGLRFLIVEDNMDAALLLRDLLDLEGYEAMVAHDGQQGLDLARAQRPDVILMDIGLPLLDGWTVAKALRADANGSDHVLIAMSGYNQPSDRAKSEQAGFDLHLAKPADLGQVFDYLSSLKRVWRCS